VEGVVEADIAWQPVGGGEAWRLALPGTDSNPNVSGPLIAFERRETTADGSLPNFDVMLYDLRTQTFYRLTSTPESETLNDISMGADGVVRVVWSVRENGNLNVYAFAFGLPPADCKPPADAGSPAEVCASPGARPLVGTLQVSRSTGKSERLSTSFEAKGSGVLCVDNAHEGTAVTAGWVWLGTDLHVGPEDFGHDVTGMARAVSLQGQGSLSALVEGKPGSAFRVRLYGEAPACGSEGDVKAGAESRHGEFIAPELLDRGLVKPQPARYFVPSGYEGPVASVNGGEGTRDELRPTPLPSCSAGGSGSLFLLGLWVLAALPRRDRSSRATRRAPVVSRR
jgi:hypothetical protein